MSDDFHPLDNPKQYVDILKPLINKEDLTKQVLVLHKKVETGERWEILKLLKLSSPIDYKEISRKPLPDGSFPKKKIIIFPIETQSTK